MKKVKSGIRSEKKWCSALKGSVSMGYQCCKFLLAKVSIIPIWTTDSEQAWQPFQTRLWKRCPIQGNMTYFNFNMIWVCLCLQCRLVSVAGQSYPLNASNAEVIMGTIIKEANKGEIDLTGFTSFWTLKQEQLDAILREYGSEINSTSSSCEVDTTGFLAGMKCSKCVCEYRNTAVAFATAKLSQVRQKEWTKKQRMS